MQHDKRCWQDWHCCKCMQLPLLLVRISTCVQGMQHRLGHMRLNVINRNGASSSSSQLCKPRAAQLQHHAVHREGLLHVLWVLHQQLQVSAATYANRTAQ